MIKHDNAMIRVLVNSVTSGMLQAPRISGPSKSVVSATETETELGLSPHAAGACARDPRIAGPPACCKAVEWPLRAAFSPSLVP